MLFTLGIAGWVLGILILGMLAVCAMLVLTVLIQKPQGGGLSAAFGASSGSGQTAFGTKTGDALTIFTIVVFVLFLGFSIALNHLMRPVAAVVTPASTTNQAPAGADGTAPPAGPTITPVPVTITPTPADAGPTPVEPPSPAPSQPPPQPSPEPVETPKTTPPAPAPAPEPAPAPPK